MHIHLTKKDVLATAKWFIQNKPKEIAKDEALAQLLKVARKRGFMTQSDLIAAAKWKWRGARTWQLAAQNTENDIKEITRAAFATDNERLRITVLLGLRGVSWPMASVILHFSFPEDYPILDVRAMRSVSGTTIYTFERWMEYKKLCCEVAKRMNVSMRDLDRALWSAGDKINK